MPQRAAAYGLLIFVCGWSFVFPHPRLTIRRRHTEPATGDEATGAVTDVELHPDVKFSLGITQYRYPPEDSADPACPDP